MSFLWTDVRGWKSDMHALIENTDTSAEGWEWGFGTRVRHITAAHKVEISTDGSAEHCVKLMAASNKPRAHKFVDMIDDRGLKLWVVATAAIAIIVSRLAFWACLIGAVVWAVLWMTGVI